MNKITYRNPKQERINFCETVKVKRPNVTKWFYQKSNVSKPWALAIVREYDKTTIILYHEQLRRGYVQFSSLYFDTPLNVVCFVKSIVNAHYALGYEISMNGADVAQLYADLYGVF
ncbi:MAG: hypothetical protein IJX16_04835 [Clostridia bacterium]|nr:hypothetical protein [Clostridia bacterium]